MTSVQRKYAVTKLLGSEPLVFVRAQTITCSYDDARPNTTLNVFFDGLKYNHRVQSRDWSIADETSPSAYKNMGEPVVASSGGKVKFKIQVEAGKFKAGDIDIIATEAAQLSDLALAGNTLGKIEGHFIAQGTLQVFRKTVSVLNVDKIDPPPPPPPRGGQDPLAQSFFTYGKQGGVFITSVDLYFYTKDTTFPITIDIRKMVNGYPSADLVSEDATLTYYPFQINTSVDASIATRFTFPVPVYLEQDQEYCFVIKSNCNTYQVWASHMGELSKETGKTIFEQPYTGSLFKSQNDSTWTTDQFEDLKFKLNIANFTPTAGNLTLGGTVPTRWVKGTQFTTTAGSNKIIFSSFEQHGYSNQTLGDGKQKITITPISVDANSSYNGISGANLAGSFPITRIIDDYTVEFQLSGSTSGFIATSSGPISTSGVITNIVFQNQTADSPTPTTLVIDPPQSGILTDRAVASPVQSLGYSIGGKTFVGAIVTNPGKGYTANVNVNAGTWPGAVTAYCEAWFAVDMNKPVSLFVPNIDFTVPVGSDLRVTHKLLDSQYNYSGGDMKTDLYSANFALYESIVANKATSVAYGTDKGQQDGAIKLNVNMTRDPSNTSVSPVLDLRSGASLTSYANAINAQYFVEDTTSTNSCSPVTGITITNGGSGYVYANTTITLVPAEDDPNYENITDATVNFTVSSGSINSITVATPGAGYTRPPTVVITSSSGVSTVATAKAIINPVNSELLPNNGYALAKYITKEIRLATPSTGIKVLSFLASTPDTSIEWYVRTSMSNDTSIHSTLGWTKLNCDVDRNKSTSFNQFYDYEFYMYDLPVFDTYNLKAVMSSKYKNMTPIFKNYRVIVVV